MFNPDNRLPFPKEKLQNTSFVFLKIEPAGYISSILFKQQIYFTNQCVVKYNWTFCEDTEQWIITTVTGLGNRFLVMLLSVFVWTGDTQVSLY